MSVTGKWVKHFLITSFQIDVDKDAYCLIWVHMNFNIYL